MEGQERRSYKRSTRFQIEVEVSPEGEKWEAAQAADLSSSGLQLQSKQVFQENDIICLRLKIQSYFSNFHLETKGKIRRVQAQVRAQTQPQVLAQKPNMFAYGVEFIGLSQTDMIRIDECVHFAKY